MKKEAYYFPHDCNARNDEKILAIRIKYGAEGYGIYFMIIERLRESSNYVSIKDYNVIAFDFRVGTDKVKSIIEDFGLFAFTEDGKCFYSESLLERMKPLDNQRAQRKEAGKKSAQKRTEINDRSTTVQRPLKKRSTTVAEKSNKVKKSKEENNKTKEEELIIPFYSEKFIEMWNILIHTPKWKKKSNSALQLSLNKLSFFEEEFAIILIEEAIEKSWQGVVYDGTQERYEKWKRQKGDKNECKENRTNNEVGGSQLAQSVAEGIARAKFEMQQREL